MVINKLDYNKIESRIDKFTDGNPKKDGSGKGIRLNKGRGGCSLKEQEVYGKGMVKNRRVVW